MKYLFDFPHESEERRGFEPLMDVQLKESTCNENPWLNPQISTNGGEGKVGDCGGENERSWVWRDGCPTGIYR
jgi:hypothetical protein